MCIKVEAQTSTFSHADSLLNAGRYQLALKNLKQIDTLQEVSNFKIGNIYTSIDDYKNAIKYYQKSLLFKESTIVKISLAKAFYKTRQYKKAIHIYKQLLDVDSNNLLITYQLGKLYYAINDLKNATITFKKLTNKDPKNPNYYYQLGLIEIRRSNGNGMLDNFLKAYKSDSTHIKSVYQLAKTFAQIRKRDSSRLFTDVGLRLDSMHVNLNKLKINELFRKKKFHLAIKRLKIIDKVSQNDLYIKKMLGRSYFNIDSLQLAKAQFLAAKKLDKEDFKIYTYLGHISKLEKNYREAFMNYLRATSIGEKERSEEHYSLGLLYIETKRPKMAIYSFNSALTDNRNKFRALYQKALTSDSFYKDKKIAYELYDEYILRFEEKDKDITKFVSNRLKELKKELFFKGEKVE